MHAHRPRRLIRVSRTGSPTCGLAIVTGSKNINLGAAVPRGNGKTVLQFSIEMFLSAEAETRGNIRSILSIYDGVLPENLLAAQWKSDFLIRIPAIDSRGRRRYREISAYNALPAGRRRFLAITSGPGGTSVYVEGGLASNYPLVMLNPDSLHGSLIVGNSPNDGMSFTGRFFGLALYNRLLNPQEISRHGRLWNTDCAAELAPEPGLAGLYLFNPTQGNTVADLSPFARPLAIPEYYRSIHKRLLSPPWENWFVSLSHVESIAINILGFVPFGFFYFLFR